MAKIFFIGNSHIDPVWLWRWQEGFSEIFATFRSALDRMKEFDDFKYTSACASYYEIVEKLDPDMFNEIRERVKEGRWEIAGGWFLQPDCNIPDGESFARHALISQRYFKEKFGVTAKTGYNVDSFGHSAALPKILKASGLESYVFRRPNTQEQGCEDYIFNWESDDSSSVCAYRIPVSYGCNYENTLEAIELIEKKGDDMMLFFGVGNHGGGPTIELIKQIKQLEADKVFSRTDEYFARLDKSDLPTIKGELQHHSRGCYSAHSYVKKANRLAEQNLIAAEKFCVMANKLVKYPYPHKKLKKAWKNLLFNQFHDVLCGCCISSAYNDASYLFGETMSVTEQESYFAMQKIALAIDTLGNVDLPNAISKNGWTWEHEILGVPVVVFNPHEWEVSALITVKEVATKVTDLGGNEIPFQTVRGEQTSRDKKHWTSFVAKIPPLGYTTYRIYTKTSSELSESTELVISENRMENGKICLELDGKTGDVARLFNKISGKYIIGKPCRAILLDESACDTWAHDEVSLGKEVGSFGNAKFEIIENGPVRAIVRSVATFESSTVTRDFCLLADDERVFVNVKIDFHEKHRALKFTFPAENETVTSRIQYGTLTREGCTGEEPCGSFIASGSLAVANDSKYGYDTESGEMRLSVLRGAAYADHHGYRDGRMEYMDQGLSEFSYCLFEHRELVTTERYASELNFAPRHIMASFHHGALPEELSCFDCDSPSLFVSCIKNAEDENGTVFRCFELEGKEVEASVRLFDKELKLSVPHHALKTFSENGDELNILEIPEKQ